MSVTLHASIRASVEQLKGLIPAFDHHGRFHDEKVFGALHEIHMPALLESDAIRPVEYNYGEGDENPRAVALREVENLKAAAAVLNESGGYELGRAIFNMATEIEAAVVNENANSG